MPETDDPPQIAFTGQWFGLKAQFTKEQVTSDVEADAICKRLDHALILRLSETFPAAKGFSITVYSRANRGCYAQQGTVIIGSVVDAASAVTATLATGVIIRNSLRGIVREFFPGFIRRLKVETAEPKQLLTSAPLQPPPEAERTVEEEGADRAEADHPTASAARRSWMSWLNAAGNVAQLAVIFVAVPLLMLQRCSELDRGQREATEMRAQLGRIEAAQNAARAAGPPLTVQCSPAPAPRVRVTCPAPERQRTTTWSTP